MTHTAPIRRSSWRSRPLGRRYFAERAAARDLAYFVRSPHIQDVPAGAASADPNATLPPAAVRSRRACRRECVALDRRRARPRGRDRRLEPRPAARRRHEGGRRPPVPRSSCATAGSRRSSSDGLVRPLQRRSRPARGRDARSARRARAPAARQHDPSREVLHLRQRPRQPERDEHAGGDRPVVADQEVPPEAAEGREPSHDASCGTSSGARRRRPGDQRQPDRDVERDQPRAAPRRRPASRPPAPPRPRTCRRSRA